MHLPYFLSKNINRLSFYFITSLTNEKVNLIHSKKKNHCLLSGAICLNNSLTIVTI
jgi:hypothetical protein